MFFSSLLWVLCPDKYGKWLQMESPMIDIGIRTIFNSNAWWNDVNLGLKCEVIASENTRHSISHCLRVIVLMDETETNFYATWKLNNVFLYIEPIMHYFQIWTTSIITRFRSRYKLLCNSVCYKRSCWLQDLMDTFEHVTDNLGSITKIQKLF